MAASDPDIKTNGAAHDAIPVPGASPTEDTPVATLEAGLLARIDLLERELLAQEAERLREDADATNLRQNEFLAMLPLGLRNRRAPIGMAGALLGRRMRCPKCCR